MDIVKKKIRFLKLILIDNKVKTIMCYSISNSYKLQAQYYMMLIFLLKLQNKMNKNMSIDSETIKLFKMSL